MMSRKDYVAIAGAINEMREYDGEREDASVQYILDRVARGIGSYLQSDNERFDSSRFLEACGVD